MATWIKPDHNELLSAEKQLTDIQPISEHLCPFCGKRIGYFYTFGIIKDRDTNRYAYAHWEPCFERYLMEAHDAD